MRLNEKRGRITLKNIDVEERSENEEYVESKTIEKSFWKRGRVEERGKGRPIVF